MKKRFICRATPDGTLKFARKRFKIEKVFSINIKLGGYKDDLWDFTYHISGNSI